MAGNLQVLYTTEELLQQRPKFEKEIKEHDQFCIDYGGGISFYFFWRSYRKLWSVAHDHTNFIDWMQSRTFYQNVDKGEEHLLIKITFENGTSLMTTPPRCTFTIDDRNITKQNSSFGLIMDATLGSKTAKLEVIKDHAIIGEFRKHDGLWYNYS